MKDVKQGRWGVNGLWYRSVWGAALACSLSLGSRRQVIQYSTASLLREPYPWALWESSLWRLRLENISFAFLSTGSQWHCSNILQIWFAFFPLTLYVFLPWVRLKCWTVCLCVHGEVNPMLTRLKVKGSCTSRLVRWNLVREMCTHVCLSEKNKFRPSSANSVSQQNVSCLLCSGICFLQDKSRGNGCELRGILSLAGYRLWGWLCPQQPCSRLMSLCLPSFPKSCC